MALIKCPECKKEISDIAPACPHCGMPMKTTPSSMIQLDTAPNKRRKYKVRMLIFMPMFIIGSPLAMFSMFSGEGGKIAFWSIVAVIGFIGLIASAIGHWLAEP
jgi:hypothetical protein